MNIKNIKLSTILLGILLIISGCFMISQPTDSFLVVSNLIGIAAMVKGIMLIVMYFKARERYVAKANTTLIVGIILTVIGLIFIFRPVVFAAVITYLLSLWFIFSSIMGLNIAKLYKEHKVYYVLNIILNVLLLIGAFIILFDVVSVVISLSIFLGVLFIFDGVSSIGWAISIKEL